MPDGLLTMPVCFGLTDPLFQHRRPLVVAGNLQVVPRRIDPAGMRMALLARTAKGEAAYWSHAGLLWTKAKVDRDVGQTRYGLTLKSEVLGIPYGRPNAVDIDLGRPSAEALHMTGWQEEAARIERLLAEGVVACGEDVYVRSAEPKIVVSWPRQSTSKPTMGIRNAHAAEDAENTCFPIARLKSAEDFVATHRNVPERHPVSIELFPEGLASLGQNDGLADFASGTLAWFRAKLEDQDPATALLRHGYGLLPAEVLEDIECLRAMEPASDPAEIMGTVCRIRGGLSDEAVEAAVEGLKAAQAGDTAVAALGQLANRIARMTRLAVMRWEFERRGYLAPEDDQALGELMA